MTAIYSGVFLRLSVICPVCTALIVWTERDDADLGMMDSETQKARAAIVRHMSSHDIPYWQREAATPDAAATTGDGEGA